MDSPLDIFWRGYNKGLCCFYLISSAGLTERVAGLYGLCTLNINLLTLCSPHSHLQTNLEGRCLFLFLPVILVLVFAQLVADAESILFEIKRDLGPLT